MLPIHLGSGSRRLFGMYSARNPAVAPRSAVLLCNPFGRDAIQLQRLYRVLSERLSRAGSDVLRFDYYGTGDSSGDDADADLDLWGEDLLTAHAELVRRSGSAQIVWAGSRLGATLAQRMAPRVSLARLVLLDPIADGRDYLELLRDQHVDILVESERLKLPPRTATFREDDKQYLDEASGFAVPRTFCDALRAIRFTPESAARDTVVICDSQTPNGQALAASAKQVPGIRVANFSHGADWTSSLVPPQVLNILVNEAGGPR